ncbi:hypothetical protein, partial [Cardiobacterium hominis]
MKLVDNLHNFRIAAAGVNKCRLNACMTATAFASNYWNTIRITWVIRFFLAFHFKRGKEIFRFNRRIGEEMVNKMTGIIMNFFTIT